MDRCKGRATPASVVPLGSLNWQLCMLQKPPLCHNTSSIHIDVVHDIVQGWCCMEESLGSELLVFANYYLGGIKDIAMPTHL